MQKRNGIIEKHIVLFTSKYVKLNITHFDEKSLKTNLSLGQINLSTHSENNMYSRINPIHNYYEPFHIIA